MLKGLKLCAMAAAICIAAPTVFAADVSRAADKPITREQQQKMTPQSVLQRLKEGNKRFVKGEMTKYDYSAKRAVSADGQHPVAIILSCVDSRSVPDLVFDQGLGNVFVARVAGNVTNQDMLGSEEFATKYAGAKLIVVMGHTACGAVQGACKGVGQGNLRALLNKIAPAVAEVVKPGGRDCKSDEQVNAIAKQNVINQVVATYENSNIIKGMVDEGKIMIVGAMHDLASGKVDFFYTLDPKKQNM